MTNLSIATLMLPYKSWQPPVMTIRPLLTQTSQSWFPPNRVSPSRLLTRSPFACFVCRLLWSSDAWVRLWSFYSFFSYGFCRLTHSPFVWWQYWFNTILSSLPSDLWSVIMGQIVNSYFLTEYNLFVFEAALSLDTMMALLLCHRMKPNHWNLVVIF